MVSAFFGQGAAEGFRKQEALDIQQEGVDVQRDRLGLFKAQALQKLQAERIKKNLAQADEFERRADLLERAMQMKPELGQSPAYRQNIANARAVAQKLRAASGVENPQLLGELGSAVAQAPPKPGPTGQKLIDLGVPVSGLSEEERKRIAGAVPSERAPSVNALVVPILKKMQAGQKISEGEQNVLDYASHLSIFDQITRMMLGAQGIPTGTPATTAKPTAPAGFDFVERRGNVNVFRRQSDGKLFEQDAK